MYILHTIGFLYFFFFCVRGDSVCVQSLSNCKIIHACMYNIHTW